MRGFSLPDWCSSQCRSYRKAGAIARLYFCTSGTVNFDLGPARRLTKYVSCGQLMTVRDIGPIIASATVAAIGNGTAFAKGRDSAAWLGLVPKQMSTGDRTILGRITKHGNRYVRTLFVQGARAILCTRWRALLSKPARRL